MKICIPLSPSSTQYFINQAYIDLVIGAGLEPVIVTPSNDALEYAQLCQGLMLPGGIDLDPNFYGECNIASYKVNPAKDDFERQLLESFRATGKPIFGICRGFQLIVRELIRERPELDQRLIYYQHINKHEQTGTLNLDRTITCHDVRFSPEGLYGEGSNQASVMYVNSMHHQALVALTTNKKPNQVRFADIRVVARSRHGMEEKERGYIVEGIRFAWGNSPILAVQWHPEELKDFALISNFFNQSVAVEEDTAGA